MVNLKKLLLISLMSFSSQNFCPVLLFDMDGIFIKLSYLKCFFELGFDILPNFDLEKRFFKFLHLIDPNPNENTKAKFNDNLLPSYMCDWLAGKICCHEMTNYMIEQMQARPEYFRNKCERRLFKKTAELMRARANARIAVPITEMVKTLKECKNKKNRNGELVNEIYLATNCNRKTFIELKRKFPYIFGCFDKEKIILSGDIDAIKPYSDFYNYIIDTHKLNPKNCYFIDDQDENLLGARECGMKTIKHKNTAGTRKRLRQIGAL